MTAKERKQIQEVLYPLYLSVVKEGLTISRKGYKQVYIIKRLKEAEISKKHELSDNQIKNWIKKFKELNEAEEAEQEQGPLSLLELGGNYQSHLLEHNIKALVQGSKASQIAEIKEKYHKRIQLMRESLMFEYSKKSKKDAEGKDKLKEFNPGLYDYMINILMNSMRAELEIIGGLTPKEVAYLVLELQKLEQAKKNKDEDNEPDNLEDFMDEDEDYEELYS